MKLSTEILCSRFRQHVWLKVDILTVSHSRKHPLCFSIGPHKQVVRSSAQVCKPGAPWVWSQSITSTLKVTADGLRRVHTGQMELTRWNNNPLKSFHFAASRLPHRERRLPQLLALTAAVAFCYKWNKNTALSSGGSRPPGRQWKISHFINTIKRMK